MNWFEILIKHVTCWIVQGKEGFELTAWMPQSWFYPSTPGSYCKMPARPGRFPCFFFSWLTPQSSIHQKANGYLPDHFEGPKHIHLQIYVHCVFPESIEMLSNFWWPHFASKVIGRFAMRGSGDKVERGVRFVCLLYLITPHTFYELLLSAWKDSKGQDVNNLREVWNAKNIRQAHL